MKLAGTPFTIALMLLLFALLLSNCATPPATTVASDSSTPSQALAENALSPPADLLQDNYQQAPLALAVQIKQINIVATLRDDDDDKIGYVASEVTGNVVQNYKGDIPSGSMIRYRFTEEYDPQWFQKWKAGEQVLVFLTPVNNGILQVFDEAAHFPMTPELSTAMQTITGN